MEPGKDQTRFCEAEEQIQRPAAVSQRCIVQVSEPAPRLHVHSWIPGGPFIPALPRLYLPTCYMSLESITALGDNVGSATAQNLRWSLSLRSEPVNRLNPERPGSSVG